MDPSPGDTPARRRILILRHPFALALAVLGVVIVAGFVYEYSRLDPARRHRLRSVLNSNSRKANKFVAHGDSLSAAGRYDEARAAMQKAKDLFVKARDSTGVAIAVQRTAVAYHRQRDYDRAKAGYEEAASLLGALLAKSDKQEARRYYNMAAAIYLQFEAGREYDEVMEKLAKLDR